MSTFSEQGSCRMISGDIQPTVPTNVILVLLSPIDRLTPKSAILRISLSVIRMLGKQVVVMKFNEYLEFKCVVYHRHVLDTASLRSEKVPEEVATELQALVW